MDEIIEVFIIDDHPIYIDGIKDAFYKSNTKYCIGGSATLIKAARKKIKKSFAKVILLDLKLPGESGVDFCAELKKNFPEKKVIVLTGETDDEILFNVWLNQADAIVMKYAGIHDLISVINSVRKGERVIGKYVPLVFNSDDLLKDINKPTLTNKEKQILMLLMSGNTRREASEKLFIAQETVNTHCKNMFTKFKVKNLQSLLRKVIDYKLFN